MRRHELALSMLVLLVVALLVNAYPPLVLPIGAVAIAAAFISAVYLFRIYLRAPNARLSIVWTALIWLVVAVCAAGAWLLIVAGLRRVVGDLPEWLGGINIAVLVGLLSIPTYWGLVVRRIRQGSRGATSDRREPSASGE